MTAAIAAMLAAAPVLTAADVQVAVTSPLACAVTLAVTIDGAPPTVEHRLEVLEGARATLDGLDGAAAAPPAAVGRTLALQVTPSSATYTLRYRVTQPEAGAFRCPVWLPVTPADGRSRAVRVAATLPEGAAAVGTFPAFAWRGTTGTVTLGHVPAFVRVPFAGADVTPPWNLARLMDGVSLGVLAAASLLWWRRSRAA